MRWRVDATGPSEGPWPTFVRLPVKETALRLGLSVHQPERIRRPEQVELLASFKRDVMVVVGYGQIIPQSIIDLPRLGIVNVHASLLPKYRGAAPDPVGDRERGNSHGRDNHVD